MSENNNEKKKGIDLVVRSAIERVLAADKEATQSAAAQSGSAEKPTGTANAAVASGSPAAKSAAAQPAAEQPTAAQAGNQASASRRRKKVPESVLSAQAGIEAASPSAKAAMPGAKAASEPSLKATAAAATAATEESRRPAPAKEAPTGKKSPSGKTRQPKAAASADAAVVSSQVKQAMQGGVDANHTAAAAASDSASPRPTKNSAKSRAKAANAAANAAVNAAAPQSDATGKKSAQKKSKAAQEPESSQGKSGSKAKSDGKAPEKQDKAAKKPQPKNQAEPQEKASGKAAAPAKAQEKASAKAPRKSSTKAKAQPQEARPPLEGIPSPETLPSPESIPGVEKEAAKGKSKAKGGKTGEKAKSSGKSPAKSSQAPKKNELDDGPVAIFSSNKLASHNQKRQAVSVITERRKPTHDHKIRIIPLGGLGEVGKNMTMIEYDENVLVVDGGVSFPEDGMFGIDLVLPDYSYLIEKKDQVRAFLLTHGHEDHIGAMPYILKDVNAPVYGSALTLGLLKGKLSEQQVKAELHRVDAREELEIGPFKVEFIRLTHSIPDSMGLAIHTPIGTILIISDFKMDMMPIDGRLMDYGRISALGEKGVLLLMSDSTNVEREGFSQSERTVGYNLDRYFAAAPGRIIVTSFASHVHRAQQVIWAAARTGRKVAVVGRGMQNMFAVAGSLGYLEIPEHQLIDIESINDYPANQVVIITTGSQGEPLSGLTRMSSGEHRQVRIMAGDTVIISATPIPGNERMVGKTVDNLFRLGANVIHERSQGIHVSGHASREELKMLLNMVQPRFFMPIHGEYRMLYKHAQLAQSVGLPADNTVVMENGQILELSRRQCRISGTVPSGRVYIDGLGVGDVGAAILKERRQLSEGGVIVISLIYTAKKNARILSGPEIYSQGFIFEKDYEHIIGEMKEKVLALCTPENLADGSLNDLRNQVRTKLAKFVLERTGRRPVIMAVISQV